MLPIAWPAWVTGVPVADATNGLRLFRRNVLASLDLAALLSRGYSVILETNYRRTGRLPTRGVADHLPPAHGRQVQDDGARDRAVLYLFTPPPPAARREAGGPEGTCCLSRQGGDVRILETRRRGEQQR